MKRPCLGFDGPCSDAVLVEGRSRCPECQSRYESARPSRRVRGRYDSKHDRLRAVTLRQQPWCSRCKTPGTPSNPLTADHIKPHNFGGKNVRANYQTLCRNCNSAKRDRLTA